ncbi:MAG: hypothetical protein M0D55_04450 [Elusimicrobiota bacterium]|nr:MAG: hypothetical protein M0D55_04450 [Elusimicrobiota bacterium]
MNKKLPFLIVGYLLGAFSLVASLSAMVYTKASVGVAAADSNCGGSI